MAEARPQAHAITRWLGADARSDAPHRACTAADGPGWVLVCTDGLWNYCSPADELAACSSRTPARPGRRGRPGAQLAEALVAWANAQGGHDNITVALARFPGKISG